MAGWCSLVRTAGIVLSAIGAAIAVVDASSIPSIGS
jgi:hypothetical protein